MRIAAAVLAAARLFGLMHLHADDRIIVVVQGGLTLSMALLSKVCADPWVAVRRLTFLGEASLALYLVHMPLLVPAEEHRRQADATTERVLHEPAGIGGDARAAGDVSGDGAKHGERGAS